MVRLWTLLLLLCTYEAICAARSHKPRSLTKQPDVLLNFMEKIYKSKEVLPPSDAGSPLILTPFIENNQLNEGRRAAYVDPTPFLNNITSYAGCFTVNKKYNSNLFFWYFPVSGQPIEDTPWIIWLQGGPGASSLFGLFSEIGPYTVVDQKLQEMPYSWSKNHSLLFIDNPVGTGFSFTDDVKGFATNQTTVGENLYTALQQFLTLFPELRKAPLTIAGESYAGKYIPSIGIQIHWNKDNSEPINLHGLSIGNGLIDPLSMLRYSYFVREVGLVDDKVADEIKEVESEATKMINDEDYFEGFLAFNSILNLIQSNSEQENLYNYLKDHVDMGESFSNFIISSEVRKALHVGSNRYSALNHVVYGYLVEDIIKSAKPWLEELLENYKVLVYNGHLDIIVAYHPSVNTYKSFSFSGADDYKTAERYPWYHDEKLAGYYKRGGNLTEVMVRGAGHMVPSDQPAAALGLITAFTRGLPLDRTTSFVAP